MAAIIIFFLALLTGCGTVVPVKVQPAAASFDGNAQTSGVLARLPDGSYQVSAHWRDRYNAMVATYGKQFSPPLTKDEGITLNLDSVTLETNLTATAQAVADFGQMNLTRRSGLR